MDSQRSFVGKLRTSKPHPKTRQKLRLSDMNLPSPLKSLTELLQHLIRLFYIFWSTNLPSSSFITRMTILHDTAPPKNSKNRHKNIYICIYIYIYIYIYIPVFVVLTTSLKPWEWRLLCVEEYISQIVVQWFCFFGGRARWGAPKMVVPLNHPFRTMGFSMK